ncbi:MAG: isoleucine--tRNA ligase [Planctomycetota bacterium]|jgi:isoleucyl-tRNA synthetase|nr:isoleucine--tRNA ligase [Planctomycetota bacterium]
MFCDVPKIPDFPALEKEILAFWEDNEIFEKRVKLNQGKPAFSFIDGPITANNPMGVHHAWGRTYKDIYQRYRAMNGFDLRYQNGFDCQGLWVEVEVEKELGLDSKGAIQEYGMDRFSEACRARVERFSKVQSEQSRRLGQWMDWNDSYFTMSDRNIETIWHFLKTCHDKGWLYRGYRPMPWCTRCGTSLSQHELADSYKEITHEAVYIKLPVTGEADLFFLVWTTTPWTLTANTALAVNPDLDYVKVRQGEETYILSAARLEAIEGEHEIVGTIKGSQLVGLTYRGPIDIPARQQARLRVIPWNEVSADEGTGIVHIAPGCGAEDYELSRTLDLEVIMPIDESGMYPTDEYEEFGGENVSGIASRIFDHLRTQGYFYRTESYQHRYPHCWRCQQELVFRLVHEWFISCREIREPMKAAAEQVQWIPSHVGKLMQDWLDNMGDWCISRRRFWGLPLPFYRCQCGTLTILGSRAELEQRATDSLEDLRELHRPWIDKIRIQCSECGNPVERVTEVGDCWLDAGIVPFSTLDYTNSDRSYWDRWFPAQVVVEMREQVRLWFYSLLFMAVTLENRPPYKTVVAYERMLDESGGKFSKTRGNMILFDEAAERMGADVMRWLYAAAPLATDIRFGYEPAEQSKRKLMTLWSVYSFFVLTANTEKPDLTVAYDPARCTDLDRWILAKLNRLIDSVKNSLESYDTASVVDHGERFFEDLSNWYLRLSRRRFYHGKDPESFRTLFHVLTTTTRILAPVIPFTCETIHQNLRTGADESWPESVHLSDFPESQPCEEDDDLIADMAQIQNVVRLGLHARKESALKVRQPLSCVTLHLTSTSVRKSIDRFREIVLSELNVKNIQFEDNLDQLVSYSIKPNFRTLGPKLGPDVKSVASQLASIDSTQIAQKAAAGEAISLSLPDGRSVTIEAEDLDIRQTFAEGFSQDSEAGIALQIDTVIDDTLRAEGVARDLKRKIQEMRKEAGLAVTDRIEIRYDAQDPTHEAIDAHRKWLMEETLTEDLSCGSGEAGWRSKSFDLGGTPITLSLRKHS